MSSKKGLTEEELNKLIEILSQRKSDTEGRTSIAEVRSSLPQLGLSEFWEEDDIEKVQKQVEREMKKRQIRNYFLFGFILTILVAPLSAYGGYQLKEILTSKYPQIFGTSEINSSESSQLEEQIALLRSETKKLEEELEETIDKKEELEKKVKELEEEKESLEKREDSRNAEPASTPKPEEEIELKSDEEPENRPSLQSFEVQDLNFELQRCQKTNTNATSQSIRCVFLITSQKDEARVYLYAGSNRRRSRIIEKGQEYLSSRVEIGSASDDYSVRNDLIKDAPTEAVITFDDVASDIEKIGVLSINSYLTSSDYNDDINIEFRNISLSE